MQTLEFLGLGFRLLGLGFRSSRLRLKVGFRVRVLGLRRAGKN